MDTESLVPQEHLLRKVDKAVDFRKLYEIVEPLYNGEEGRPSVDSVVLFKIVLVQHLDGIPSLRGTLRRAQTDIAYRWFLGYTLNEELPHFSTVSYNFRHRFTKETVERIFQWVLNEAGTEIMDAMKEMFRDVLQQVSLIVRHVADDTGHIHKSGQLAGPLAAVARDDFIAPILTGTGGLVHTAGTDRLHQPLHFRIVPHTKGMILERVEVGEVQIDDFLFLGAGRVTGLDRFRRRGWGLFLAGGGPLTLAGDLVSLRPHVRQVDYLAGGGGGTVHAGDHRLFRLLRRGRGGPSGASGVALVLVSSAMLANTSLSRLGPHTPRPRVQGFSSAYKNTAYCPVRRCFV